MDMHKPILKSKADQVRLYEYPISDADHHWSSHDDPLKDEIHPQNPKHPTSANA